MFIHSIFPVSLFPCFHHECGIKMFSIHLESFPKMELNHIRFGNHLKWYSNKLLSLFMNTQHVWMSIEFVPYDTSTSQDCHLCVDGEKNTNVHYGHLTSIPSLCHIDTIFFLLAWDFGSTTNRIWSFIFFDYRWRNMRVASSGKIVTNRF